MFYPVSLVKSSLAVNFIVGIDIIWNGVNINNSDAILRLLSTYVFSEYFIWRVMIFRQFNMDLNWRFLNVIILIYKWY